MASGPASVEVNERALFALVDEPLPEDVGIVAVQQSLTTKPRLPARAFRSISLVGVWPAATRDLALEHDRGVLFLLVPVAMTVGVFAYLALPQEPSLWWLVTVAIVLSAAGFAARNHVALSMALMLAGGLVSGAAFARLETARASTKMLGAEISTVLTGRVAEVDYLANGRVRLTLDVTETARPKLRYAPERVRVSARSVPQGIKIGSVVSGGARLFPPSGPLRPGSYDFAYESYYDGIGGNGFFFRTPVLVATTEDAPLSARFHAWIGNLRNAIAAHIESRVAGKAEGEIVAALIVGTRAGIPEDVNESLRRTGLAHILSISGLHMALVAASVMGTMRLAFAALPAFASRRAVKKAAALVALTAITGYLFISGADVAAQRSYIMLAVMLVAVLFDRAALTMRNLAIAALGTLTLSPHEVVGPSFQMSFAATAALIGGFQIWTNYRRKNPRKRYMASQNKLLTFGSRAIGLVAMVAVTSILAGLATTIYGVWHFQRISPLSLIANVLVSPIITLAMWSGVLASVLAPVGLDGPIFALMGKLIGLMLSISAWLSERSPVDAVGAIPSVSVAMFTLALVVGALSTTRLRWLAIPPLVLGLIAITQRTSPDLLISEDGKLVAWVAGDRLVVNRSRPNAFTITDWQRATATSEISKPTMRKEDASKAGSSSTVAHAAEIPAPNFLCDQSVCTLQQGDVMVAHVQTAEQVDALCGNVTIIISADPTAQRCRQGNTQLLSARDLAQHGTATINFRNGDVQIAHSISRPYRPWHDHRRFSRAARGMAPFVPRPRPTRPSPQ